MMEVVYDRSSLRERLAFERRSVPDYSLALVPTMGSLHEGHRRDRSIP
ncbi:MAG: pantoate--beta-alanine ligase [Spirochaetia bacterium]|nr:pantoate--beta-alanine ligase [Spirochaetia bacterium]